MSSSSRYHHGHHHGEHHGRPGTRGQQTVNGAGLMDRARRAMVEAGFDPDFSDEIEREVDAAEKPIAPAPDLRDLRSLLWSSIDNTTSRDLDQIEYAERLPNGDIRVLVGIADVDAFVPQDSATDERAAENATSVYATVTVFPMLPDELSAGLTSLLEDTDHLVMVTEMEVAENGAVRRADFYRAIARNFAKLDYESVGDWLQDEGPLPPAAAEVPGMEEQLRLQWEAAERLLAARARGGALDIETVEAQPVVAGGRVVDLKVTPKNKARALIENFMVSVNGALAGFLEESNRLSLERVVRVPARWPRIVAIAEKLGEKLPDDPDPVALAGFMARRKAAEPKSYVELSLSIVKLLGPGVYEAVRPGHGGQGHFGLALPRYAHSTAPNRRYPDLVTQRLLKATLANATEPYDFEKLARLAAHCTERASAAGKVERTMRKIAAAVLFGERVGQVFQAVVTGASVKGTWVRTMKPPVEGRLIRGRIEDADVGDRVKVRLLSVDTERGWIDFELID